MENIHRVDTVSSITITPEQFERLYLGPPNVVKGDLRKTFGNPTPIGIAGLLLAITPLTCELMGWRGAYGVGTATVGTYYFLGGFCSELAAVGNFFLGNGFPTTFFAVYGAFFLSYGFTLTPYSGSTNEHVYPKGAEDPGFMASLGFFAIFMGVFTFVIILGSLRTNLILMLTFTMLCPTFMVFGASRLYGAAGNMEKFHSLEKTAGAIGFGSICTGWYLFLAEILAMVDFPYQIPVLDLSKYVPSATELRQRREQNKKDEESSGSEVPRLEAKQK